jgi:aminoglycoside phosphotransferase (APT) family kinase protein
MRAMDPFGAAVTPLEGGFSGETFVAEAAGERTVVRIYAGRGRARGAQAPEIDAALLRLVRGLLPVPSVLEVRRPDEASGTPGLLVTAFLPGTRLDLLLPDMSPRERRTVGANVGALLARLAQMPMLRGGVFVDGDLRLGDLPPGADDLVDWVAAHIDGTCLGTWPAAEREGLLSVAEAAQVLLDRVQRVCLVHSDLNPKNLLVDPATGEVTGLLDWEFAHAGLPVTDLGNLLRFERETEFAGAVLRAYAERVPDPAEGLLDRARAADLFALVELASRRGANPVADRAHDLLRAVARSRDLHAVP